MRRLFPALTVFGLFLASGCAESPDVATPGETSGQTESQVAKSEESEDPGVEMTEPSAGTTTEVSEADTATTEASAAANTDKKPAEVDPIVAGLEFPDVNISDVLQSLKTGYNASPKDPEAVTKYVGLCYQLGMIHAQQGNKNPSQAAFVRAAEIVQKGIDDGLDLAPEMKAAIFYQLATVQAATGKPEDALGSIEKAIENGFTQLGEIKEESDLASVRELPDFSEKFAAWEIKAREAMMAELKNELEHNTPFPFDFALTNAVSGEPITLADFKGKVCIVDIWGTWCPPCREEIPSFIKLQEKFGDSGFQMIGLNQESGADDETKIKKITDYIANVGVNYPCALLSEDILDQVPDFGGFPTTLFIDRSGTVRLKAVGLHEYEYLESVVEMLLAEPATP